MDNQSALSTLGPDVLNIIVNLLHAESPRSLRQFALVSKSYKAISERLLYRVIELGDGSTLHPNRLTNTKHIVDRLSTPKDQMSMYVRHLRITGLNTTGETLDETDVERIIVNVAQLEYFSWNASIQIPERIISKLESQWPNVRLVINKTKLNPNDSRLLQSPLLYSLRYPMLASTSPVPGSMDFALQMRLPDLKEVLLGATNLRSLAIDFESSFPNCVHLSLQPSDRLPPLRALRISGRPGAYMYYHEHCRIFSQCMDWTRLRRLDLGITCSQYFLEEIGSHLTNLKSLTMGIVTGKNGELDCRSLGVIVNFIQSLDLHELRLTDHINATETMASAIVESQTSLQELSYLPYLKRDHFSFPLHNQPTHMWEPSQLRELTLRNPGLSQLEIHVTLVEQKWPHDFIDTLVTLNRLKSLKIAVELRMEASEFSGECGPSVGMGTDLPPLDETLGRKVTIDTFRAFFINDPNARLNYLEVCFTRTIGEIWNPSVSFPIGIQRMERDDAPNPDQGGFNLGSSGGWLLGGGQGLKADWIEDEFWE